MRVEVPYERSFKSPKNLETTYRVLADYKTHLEKHFPGLETLEQGPNGEVTWRFEPIKYSSMALELKAKSRVRLEPSHTIALDAVPTSNMADLSGAWKLTANGESTSIHFTVRIAIEVPVPSFLRSMAQTVAGKELKKLLDRYVDNLEKALAA